MLLYLLCANPHSVTSYKRHLRYNVCKENIIFCPNLLLHICREVNDQECQRTLMKEFRDFLS